MSVLKPCPKQCSRKPSRRTGFTLVELLVVVAIIIILIAILVPSMSRAMAMAQAAKCQTNQRGIGKSFISWSTENKGIIPNAQKFDGNDPVRWSWMGNEIGLREDNQLAAPSFSVDQNGNQSSSTTIPGVFDGYYNTGPDPNYDPNEDPNPENAFYFNGDFEEGKYAGTFNWAPEKEGVIVPYLGGRDQSKKMYRCPTLDVAPLGARYGSNGLFDYVSVAAFTGARLAKIPATSQWTYPWLGESSAGPTPMVLEEDPALHLNNRNHDPRWGNADSFASTHAGNTGNFATIDGGAHKIQTKESGKDIGIRAGFEIRAQYPSGVTGTLWDGGFGHWNGR